MAITRKQLIQVSSIICLILVTALSGYATSRSIQLSLPIPRGLAYSTTILPLFSVLLVELSQILVQRQNRQPLADSTRSPLIIIANVAVVIYSTVIITLLGTHVARSPEFNCGLREHWASLFQQKNEVIRAIQDNLQCCGFKHPRDMAWPFPDKNHRVDACQIDFGRTRGCLDGWKREEQRHAGIFMVVVGLVSLWQLCLGLIKARRESWLHQIVPGRISHMIADERNHSMGSSRKRIDYTAAFDPCSDENDETDNEAGVIGSNRRTLNGVTPQARSSTSNETRDEDQEHSVRSNV